MKYIFLASLALAFSASHADEKQIIRTSIIAHNAKIVSVVEKGEEVTVKFKTAYQKEEMTAVLCKENRPWDVKSTISTIKRGGSNIIGNPHVELRMISTDDKTLCIVDAALSIL